MTLGRQILPLNIGTVVRRVPATSGLLLLLRESEWVQALGCESIRGAALALLEQGGQAFEAGPIDFTFETLPVDKLEGRLRVLASEVRPRFGIAIATFAPGAEIPASPE